MMDQTGSRVSARDRALQGGDRQRPFQPVTCGPAHDLPPVQIDDDSEVQPALDGPDVRDVSTPFLVRALGCKVLVEQIGRYGPGMLTVGGALEATSLTRDKAVLAHKAGYAMSPDLMAIVYQVTMHARAAIAAVRQCKRRADMGKIYHVLPLTVTSRTVAPGKEPTLADAKDTTHPTDGEARLLCLNEVEAHRLASFAKKAAAS
jgi:hypothetical protein